MRDKGIWVFNAGSAFAGNPKWLFLYLQEHHPEITCYWFCYHRSLVKKMRDRGYNACLYRSLQARRIGERAGVYVVEQNKEVFQGYFDGVTVLNLWHGVTCKKLEQAVTEGFMEERLAMKHIRNEPVYRRQLMLVTSPEQEEIFKEQCGVSDDRIVRAPYPCSFYRGDVCTFGHDLRARKGLGPNAKIAVYAPTFRDFDRHSFFAKAIPDMKALIAQLEAHDWLLVVKTHPQMEGDFQLNALKREYGSHPRLLFWDNGEDFYEVMDRVDFAIVDYSSIFFDLLARGVKRFARYIFDYGDKEHLRDFAVDYLDVTCGTVCESFDELLAEFARGDETDPAEIGRVFDRAWAYSRDHTIEDIVQRALSYEPPAEKLPTLYSFDVFDTLIARTGGTPGSIFLYVQERMRQSSLEFPPYLVERYPEARTSAEDSCRQYMMRTLETRGDGRTEITFDMIFERMGESAGLGERQIQALKDWELEGELASTMPIPETVGEALALAEQGETVLLISDMYLPESFVKRLLAKADPRLAALPLFLSSTTGRQKTKKGLFLDAYHAIDYRFAKWVHTGDRRYADVRMPKKLGIEGRLAPAPGTQNAYVDGMARAVNTYDAALVAGLMGRMARACETDEDAFTLTYATLYFVPYVYWAIDHALRCGTEHLYFIARDGYHLKRIADAIIDARSLELQTTYLYGSRQAWRLASQVDEIDDDFFTTHGNFTGAFSYEGLLQAGYLDDSSFASLFPELAFLKEQGAIGKTERNRIVEVMRDSKEYRSYLIDRARGEREIVLDYFRQEIDFSQRFAFVEYWGRGYTQECHTRLLRLADSRATESTYYYARSIQPSTGANVRHNLTDSTKSLLFAEALFANMPYETVSGYRRDGGAVLPVYEPRDYDEALFRSFEELLPRFAAAFARLGFLNPERTMRELHDYAVGYYNDHVSDAAFLKYIAPLKDSSSVTGEPAEFAPRLSIPWAVDVLKQQGATTASPLMSIARANPLARFVVSRYEKRKRNRSGR